MVLVLFAAFLVGGVTMEHFYCPERSAACTDGSALAAQGEGDSLSRAEGQLDVLMQWSLLSGGLSRSMSHFTDYYCCCVHDFARKHSVCKNHRLQGNGLS